MDPFDDNPRVLRPLEIGLILLMTMAIFFCTVLFVEFPDQRLSLLAGEILLITPALVYVLCRRLPLLQIFRIRPLSPAQIAATLFIFLPTFILTDELDRIVQKTFPMSAPWFESLVELVQIHSLSDAIVMLLAAVFSAAVFEEMLFRGLLQRTLEHFQPPAIAILLAALFFAVAHFSPWTAVQITVLGLVLGYVVWKSGTILPSIVIHALNNSLALIMMNSPDASLSWYVRSGHVRPLWLAVAVVLCLPAYTFFNKSCEKNVTF